MAVILDTSSLYRFGDLASNPNNYVNGSVDRAYMQFLGRDATPGEITYWEQVYAANPNYRVEDLDAAILGSGEYFADNTTANTPLPSQNQQWANALYTSVLGATNSSAEANTDLPFLTAAESNARDAVGAAVVGSPEFHNDVTIFVYESDLHRLPSAGELALWQPIVGPGGGHARRPQRRRAAADRGAQLAGILPGPVRPDGRRPAHQQLVADEPLQQPPGSRSTRPARPPTSTP